MVMSSTFLFCFVFSSGAVQFRGQTARTQRQFAEEAPGGDADQNGHFGTRIHARQTQGKSAPTGHSARFRAP